MDKKKYTVNSRYLKLSTRDQQICSRHREFDLSSSHFVYIDKDRTACFVWDIESSTYWVIEISRFDCIYIYYFFQSNTLNIICKDLVYIYSKQIKICLKESFSQSLFYVRYHSRIATSELLADHDRIIFPKWYSISSLCADLHGVLTMIHRKRFYHKFILINLTLLHAGLYRCFSPIPTD